MTELVNPDVLHDVENHQFTLTVDNQVVLTKYRIIEDETLEFYSTYTPTELRGHGLAAHVVDAALDYTEENNLKVAATCWYFKKIMDRRAT